ncbi:hypothetical protein NYP20_12050 [Pseudomonas sp. N3-W]|uniref:hypothetical protein n=1 Tax=Pseudomonas sp. N3-W TaxID=2975049 RepID=UPI00217D7C78|nr:hypothetical protein [Pseudomonas sp. N3-W]UWF52379.1 hypothetical protein NYP20_12050 [Pseudomonas sp. N3-W]
MIQRPASGTFDLELGKLTHPGKQSIALTASAFFQHLQLPFAKSRPIAGNKKPDALAGFVLK